MLSGCATYAPNCPRRSARAAIVKPLGTPCMLDSGMVRLSVERNEIGGSTGKHVFGKDGIVEKRRRVGGIPVISVHDQGLGIESKRETLSSYPQVPKLVAQNLYKHLHIEYLFPFQSAVFKFLFSESSDACGDVLVQAPTGSGKTLIYAIPMVAAALKSVTHPCIQGLVLLPTHDLAEQVGSVFRTLLDGAPQPDRVAIEVLQSRSLPTTEHENKYPRIIVSTPGRLVDRLDQNAIDLRFLRWFVVDETDRLLQQAYQEWCTRLLETAGQGNDTFIPPLFPMRKILLSATQTQRPLHLTALRLQDPVYFVYERCIDRKAEEIGDGTMSTRAPHGLQFTSILFKTDSEKLVALLSLFAGGTDGFHKNLIYRDGSMIIFTKSVLAAHRLTRFLQIARISSEQLMDRLEPKTKPSLPIVAEISKHLPLDRRRHILESFREGQIRVLICSDIMARGIDVEGIECVLNYDVPAHLSTFLHRVGRTARAGRAGNSLTFLLEKQASYFHEEMLVKGAADITHISNSMHVDELVAEHQRSELFQFCHRVLSGVRVILQLEHLHILPVDDPPSDLLCMNAVLDDQGDQRTESSSGSSSERKAALLKVLCAITIRNWT